MQQATVKCPQCDGQGKRLVMDGGLYRARPCESCAGTGKVTPQEAKRIEEEAAKVVPLKPLWKAEDGGKS